MAITTFSAWWFLPFVLPICFYVAFTDIREMRITNQAVLALGIVFLVIGLIALPFDLYLWRLVPLAPCSAGNCPSGRHHTKCSRRNGRGGQ
jgi:prepilin peptidase CpaA